VWLTPGVFAVYMGRVSPIGWLCIWVALQLDWQAFVLAQNAISVWVRYCIRRSASAMALLLYRCLALYSTQALCVCRDCL
jgi:hypothetical protein